MFYFVEDIIETSNRGKYTQIDDIKKIFEHLAIQIIAIRQFKNKYVIKETIFYKILLGQYFLLVHIFLEYQYIMAIASPQISVFTEFIWCETTTHATHIQIHIFQQKRLYTNHQSQKRDNSPLNVYIAFGISSKLLRK